MKCPFGKVIISFLILLVISLLVSFFTKTDMNGIWYLTGFWSGSLFNLIFRDSRYPNIKKLSESIKDWDGYTTCHGWSASMLLRLISDNKMKLAEEFAAIEYEINEQHCSTDELNERLDNIVERARY